MLWTKSTKSDIHKALSRIDQNMHDALRNQSIQKCQRFQKCFWLLFRESISNWLCPNIIYWLNRGCTARFIFRCFPLTDFYEWFTKTTDSNVVNDLLIIGRGQSRLNLEDKVNPALQILNNLSISNNIHTPRENR